MYIPPSFNESDLRRIVSLVQANPFGMLVTVVDGVPTVSHLPFLLEESANGGLKLWGHVARANPQWKHLSSGRNVLVVFSGPHAYISPAWYAAPGVPTWNYAVAHLHGKPRLITSDTELMEQLRCLTDKFESMRPNPWTPTMTDENRRNLLAMIVGFEIQITHTQGKFKLGQNRSLEDQRRVAVELARSGNATEVALSKLMQLPEREGP